MSEHQKVTYIGKVDYRNKQLTFGIKESDRTRHTYIIGKTGMGKSTLLENLAIQDINNGEGICVIDPHGSMAEKLLDFIPEHRVKDVIYFAPFDSENPVGLNILEQVDVSKRHLVANGLMAAFKKIFGEDRFSDRIQYILNNIILALLENEGQSLLGVNRMLTDKEYRKFIVSNIKDPSVKSFWEEEFVKAGEKYQQEAAPGIQNKIGQFISNPLIRNIIGQHKTSFNIRDVMDKKKILIVNLSKGKVGEGNADLIGSLIITKIYLAAMSRADAGSKELDKLPPFYFYVDEFQNFANESFASILSESRKYKLALTVAHQYIEQMEDEVRAAVFGNVGTMITFRVGAADAEVFEKEFAPYFIMDDIVNLSAYQVYLRLMIDGVGSKPFSAHMLDPITPPPHSYADAVINFSRHTYGRPVKEVQAEVADFYLPRVKPVEVSKEIKPEPKRFVPVTEAPRYESSRHETPRYTKNYEAPRQEAPRYAKQEDVSRFEKREERKEYSKPHTISQPQVNTPVSAPVQQPPVSVPTREVHEKKKEETKPQHRNETPRPQETKTIFDDKPAVSLKDAIARALTESKIKETPDIISNAKVHEAPKEIEVKKEEKKKEEKHKTEVKPEIKPEAKNKDEIPEGILRKIIGEE